MQVYILTMILTFSFLYKDKMQLRDGEMKH